MARRRLTDLPDLVDDSDIEENQHIDIGFIPDEHESSDGESDGELDENTLSHNLPTGAYEHVKSTYRSTQKLLEPNHIYNWKNNALNDSPPDDEFRLSSCCGCLSLKSGTIFCGICCIILAIIAIVLLFVTHIQWKTIIINTNDEIVKIIYTINLVMTILISILLIIGAVKKNTYIMLPWVILGILLLIALLVSVLYTSAAYFLNDEEVYRLLYGILSLVFGLITFIGYSYCWFVVHSYYQQLRLEKTSLSVGPYGRPYSYQRP